MSWHVSKDGIDVVCDTEEELAVAITVLRNIFDGPGAPAWAVGGPVDRTVLQSVPATQWSPLDPITPNLGETVEVSKPVLTTVPTESPDSDPIPVMPQHISLPRKQNEVLEAVILFPEGVTTNSLSTLLGVSQMVIGSRIQELKVKGLIEKLPGHKAWRATQLARRSKVVCG